MIAENPLVWFLEVDDLIVDVRHVPLDIQVTAFQRGLIPYIPALGADGTRRILQAAADTADDRPQGMARL